MANRIFDFVSRLSGAPFIVQFVIDVAVGGSDHRAIEVVFYLVPAASEEEAKRKAEGMIDQLTESHKNSEGDVVISNCIGIHRIDQLEYIDDDQTIQLGNFIFSTETRLEHLINGTRGDLPNLGG